MSARRLGFRIVEEQPDISMKCPLVALEGQDVVAVLIDDPPGDVTLTIEGVDGHDRSLQRQHLQQPGHGGDFIGFRVGGDLRQDEALVTAPGGDHMQRRFAAGRVERATQDLTVDSNDTLGGFGKPRHEALEAGAELVGIEQAKDPAERVVARRAMLQGQKTAQERFLVLGELGHVHRALPATQHRAQRNHQDFQQIMPTGIAGARIFQPFKAGDEPVHVSSSTYRIQNAVGRSDRKPTRKLKCSCQSVSNAIPLRAAAGCLAPASRKFRDQPMSKSILRIHPAIAFARVGNSEDYYLAPETMAGVPVPGSEPPVMGGLPIRRGTENTTITDEDLRDTSGAMKRQAARFKIFAYSEDEAKSYPASTNDEIKIGDEIGGKTVTDIIWTVHVANKKANTFVLE